MATGDLTLLDHPAYPPAVAGRLIGLRSQRVSRWLRGYEYSYSAVDGTTRTVRQAPLVARSGVAESRDASFLDLIDLLFVKKFLEHGLPLQRVRRALVEAERIFGGHHFAQRKFFTDGREIYLQVDRDAEDLMQLLAGGQWVIAPVIKTVAKQIDFDDRSGLATRWYPLGRGGRIVVDPTIGFGAPIILNRGVKTSVVYDLYRAENEDISAVVKWMELRPADVRKAITFEQQLRAA